jgi:hypothetical protein
VDGVLAQAGITGITQLAQNYPQVLQGVANKPTTLPVPAQKKFSVRKFLNLLSIG